MAEGSTRLAQFTTTHWTVVLAAGHKDSPRATGALEELCRSYWYPLYAFVRRQGHDMHEAQDLTQEFLAGFLESPALAKTHPDKGHFRTYLLACLKKFLSNEQDKRRALKRGGGRVIISWDQEAAEGQYRLEPTDVMSPDRLFDQSWAVAMLGKVFEMLQRKCQAAGKGWLFGVLRPYLEGDKGQRPYSEVAAELESKPGTVAEADDRSRAASPSGGAADARGLGSFGDYEVLDEIAGAG